MHRFFIPAELFHPTDIILPKDISQQICRVLRLKPGTEIMLLDDQGFEYTSRLSEVSESHCTASVITKQASSNEADTKITLLIALTQREKFELILQKCTELGVTTFLPIITTRTLIQKTSDADDKTPRWKKIITEAAEQSHRGRIPTLSPALKYADALKKPKADDSLKLILWEEEANHSIKQHLRDFKGKHISLIIGPEGGLSEEEVELAKASGYIPVSLGKRILRMETAAIYAAGVVLYELG
ncbi:MAG: 16S rRNA (uracil(1498)-N(3))-methyltransferase [Chloroflexi bacterium HGW-Chloroflexi-4]|jgi:16S rRNA (uracil1498-N3)-methyltransferase|nr:MAG: 16S rRNA (uracil(1498)-N(3))-methyltransferase [Chloroflexi bacterium HGW-Chloroflexi-4]